MDTENNLTLEQELTARIFLHKVAIAGGVIMKNYMENQRYIEGETNISEPLLEELADQYSDKLIKQAFEKGTFEDLYNSAWESIMETMPEHTKVI